VAPELWVRAPGVTSLEGRTWTLPGLDLEVAATADDVQVEGDLWKVRFPVGTEDLSLRFGAR
jgi:hypothetical protein